MRSNAQARAAVVTERVVARQFAFTTRAYMAVDEVSGESVGLDEVDTRTGWLLNLIACAGAELVARLWQPGTFDVLAAGRDQQGRKLPAQGHVAAARLGWTPCYPDGIYVPSRVTRVVTAQVTSTLRTLAYRDTAIGVLCSRFDSDTGRLAPATGSEVCVPSGFARGVCRQLAARSRRGEGTQATWLRITDLQGPPQIAALARLSAADRQLAQLTVAGGELVLTVKLPTCPAPAGRAQWRWVRLTAAIPEHLHGRPVTDWHLPSLVLDRGGVLWRCAGTEMVPAADPVAGTVAVGVDWSPSTLGAAALVAEGPNGLSSDFHGWTYDDRGLGVKLARLQTEGQMLHRKSARLRQLALSASPEVRDRLEVEDRGARGAPHRGGCQKAENQPGVGVPLRLPSHRLFRRGGRATHCGGGPHYPRNPFTWAGQQQPSRAVRPPPSCRCPRAHRRRGWHCSGFRACEGIVRVVSGLRRTALAPGRLPQCLVRALRGRG